MHKMTSQTYRVAPAETATTNPDSWWACDTISAASAAENFVDAEKPTEDGTRAVVVVDESGKRQRFSVAVTIIRHLEALEN